jgi:hypothetical protein
MRDAPTAAPRDQARRQSLSIYFEPSGKIYLELRREAGPEP